MVFYLIKNIWSLVVLPWFQEPTKNKIGNGRNGGKENLVSSDEVGFTNVIFTKASNIIETWNSWATAKHILIVRSQEHGSAFVTYKLNLTSDEVNLHHKHIIQQKCLLLLLLFKTQHVQMLRGYISNLIF